MIELASHHLGLLTDPEAVSDAILELVGRLLPADDGLSPGSRIGAPAGWLPGAAHRYASAPGAPDAHREPRDGRDVGGGESRPGTQNSTAVPAPSAGEIRHQPPASRARSSMTVRPRWPRDGAELNPAEGPARRREPGPAVPPETVLSSTTTPLRLGVLAHVLKRLLSDPEQHRASVGLRLVGDLGAKLRRDPGALR